MNYLELIFNIYIILVLYFFAKRKIKKKLINETVLLTNVQQFVFSMFILLNFLFFFIIYFRMFRFLIRNYHYIETEKIVSYLDFILGFRGVDVISCIILLFLILNLTKLYFFGKIRFHYIRIHYFLFMRNRIFRAFFYYLSNHTEIMVSKLKINIKVYLFLRDILIKIIIAIYLGWVMIKQPDKIYLSWVPWYGLFFFFKHTIVFSSKFRDDFDILSVQSYLPNYYCVIKDGYDKLRLYHIQLVLNQTNFDFFFQDYWFYYIKDFTRIKKKMLFCNLSPGLDIFDNNLSNWDYVFIHNETFNYLLLDNLGYNNYILSTHKYSFL